MSGMDGARAARRSAAASKAATASAKRRRCPACGRKAALSAPVYWPEGHASRCNYCGHEVGFVYGIAFGYDGKAVQG
jgi:ribosomal protein S14